MKETEQQIFMYVLQELLIDHLISLEESDETLKLLNTPGSLKIPVTTNRKWRTKEWLLAISDLSPLKQTKAVVFSAA